MNEYSDMLPELPSADAGTHIPRSPVAWRVKDFADGWVICRSEAEARRLAEPCGKVVQPLYPGQDAYMHATEGPGVGHVERLRNELAANTAKPDYLPVTDSSLTYGDLRLMAALLNASAHKLADMLCEREPHRLPEDGDTEMTITVADARRLAWALLAARDMGSRVAAPVADDASGIDTKGASQ